MVKKSRDPFEIYKRQAEENVRFMKKRKQLNVIIGNDKCKQQHQPQRRPLQEIKPSNILETRGLKKRLEVINRSPVNKPNLIPTQPYDSSTECKNQQQRSSVSISSLSTQIVTNTKANNSNNISLPTRDKFVKVKQELTNSRNLNFRYTTLQPSLIEQSNSSIQNHFDKLNISRFDFIINSDKPGLKAATHEVQSVFSIGKFMDSTKIVNTKTGEQSTAILLLTDSRFKVKIGDKLILNDDSMITQMINGKEVKIYKEWNIFRSEFNQIDFFN